MTDASSHILDDCPHDQGLIANSVNLLTEKLRESGLPRGMCWTCLLPQGWGHAVPASVSRGKAELISDLTFFGPLGLESVLPASGASRLFALRVGTIFKVLSSTKPLGEADVVLHGGTKAHHPRQHHRQLV